MCYWKAFPVSRTNRRRQGAAGVGLAAARAPRLAIASLKSQTPQLPRGAESFGDQKCEEVLGLG